MSFDLWTLGFQAVNVLVLVWLLQRYFWTPVAAMIAARQAKSTALLAEAEATRAKAEAALAQIKQDRTEIAQARSAALSAAHDEGKAAAEALLDTARAEAASLHDAAKAARVRAAATLKAAALEDAQGLALAMAAKLAARLEGGAIDAAFLDWLTQGLGDLSASEREALADAALDVVSAKPQDSAAQERITAAITAALGQQAAPTFRTDPALIGGLELHSPHFALKNSWAADLEHISAALHGADPDKVVSDAA